MAVERGWLNRPKRRRVLTDSDSRRMECRSYSLFDILLCIMVLVLSVPNQHINEAIVQIVAKIKGIALYKH